MAVLLASGISHLASTMNVLAIIPARGGSKGLPGKNIRPLAGHPLIAYSVAAALKSKYVTRTIVSTDDTEIAEVAVHYGAECPFMRPAKYAQDMSTDLEVFDYTLRRLILDENYQPDLVLQLRPTSPIRLNGQIDACIEKMLAHPEADSLRIMTEAPQTPYKMWRLPEGEPYAQSLLVVPGIAEPYNEPRQRLPKAYWQIGTLDVVRPRAILEQGTMSGRNIIAHVVDRNQAVDIDDIESFVLAERALEALNCVQP